MVDIISDHLHRKTNELIFIRDQRTSSYDYQNYTPGLTVKKIPKKQIVFFFTNMTSKVNFDSLYTISLYTKILYKFAIGTLIFQTLVLVLCIFLIKKFEWDPWLFILLPICFFFYNAGIFIMVRNFVRLKNASRNRKVWFDIQKYLKDENAYWFNKYRVVFEADINNLDIRLIIADEEYKLSNNEIELVNILTERLDEARLNNLKMSSKQMRISKPKLPVYQSYEWNRMEINMFLRHNKF